MDSGIVLAGRYRLDERLGHGGMGEVWGARDLRLGRDVAVKVLRDADPGEAEVRRFVREATVAAGLQHPGITVVFDADAHDGRLFIVTELLSGKDLGKVLAAHSGGLPLDRLLDFGIQLADALAAAHGRGIIHRDLKPTNLFVQADERLPNGRLKVCDFGLARDLTSSSRVTRAGEVFGTPAYMAPEQWSTAAVDPGADLYAVGCILYEMVTGRIPFEGPSMPAFMAQHLTQPPVPPHNLKPGIPAGLNDLVLSLLSKEAANRPPSASEVLAILTRLRDVRRQAPSPARRQAAPAKTPGIRVPSGLMRTLASHAKSRPIHTLTGHTDLVYAVAFSPDGSLLATSSYDRTARLWDIATGQTIRTLTGHGPMYQVAFSPDGALVATTGGNGPARLWDTASGGTLRTLTGGAHAVAFSPDGTLLAASSGGGRSAWLWDAATGQIVRTFTGHTGSVLAVAFSPDGILLATSGSDNTARLWDTTTGQTIRTLTGHTGRVNAVAFSPDGILLATSGSDNTARLWDTTTGQTIRTLTGHTGSVAFSPDGTLLATSGGRTIRLSDTVTGQTIHTLADHTGNVNAVAFSPDGTLLAVGGGRTARLWVLG